MSEALARFLFQQLVLALDFCHARGKVRGGGRHSQSVSWHAHTMPLSLFRCCCCCAPVHCPVSTLNPVHHLPADLTHPQVSRGVKLANTLLALCPGQLPLVKLADFGFSKDTAAHSAPASQVCLCVC